jgi:hypothetical protein
VSPAKGRAGASTYKSRKPWQVTKRFFHRTGKRGSLSVYGGEDVNYRPHESAPKKDQDTYSTDPPK